MVIKGDTPSSSDELGVSMNPPTLVFRVLWGMGQFDLAPHAFAFSWWKLGVRHSLPLPNDTVGPNTVGIKSARGLCLCGCVSASEVVREKRRRKKGFKKTNKNDALGQAPVREGGSSSQWSECRPQNKPVPGPLLSLYWSRKKSELFLARRWSNPEKHKVQECRE